MIAHNDIADDAKPFPGLSKFETFNEYVAVSLSREDINPTDGCER
jgi:hypothetical protein